MTISVNNDKSQAALWSKLLTAARCRNHQLARNLEAFRVEGTQIVKLKNGNFVLRPVFVDSENGGPGPGWQDEADYRRYAKKFLAPFHDLLVELLAGLKEEEQIALL